MSRFFVYLNNWNSFDWRGELVGKRGWCCSYRFAWAWWVNEERSSTRPQQPLRTKQLLFYFKTQATLVHCDCAMVNQELLCLKLPSACLPMVYMRVFTRSSGISTQRQQWARVSLHFAWAIRWSPSTFALHLPISVLNDRLFLNRPWLMMSNPKIPSNTVFAFFFLSYSRATSFHSCLPCFTLTSTACLPPRCQRDWRGLTNVPLSESQCQETTRWRRTAKGKGAVTPYGHPSHSSVPPPPLAPSSPRLPVFMLIVSVGREQPGMTHH